MFVEWLRISTSVPYSIKRQGLDMESKGRLTGRLLAAGRALTGVSQSELATTAGIPLDILRRLEFSAAAWIPEDEF